MSLRTWQNIPSPGCFGADTWLDPQGVLQLRLGGTEYPRWSFPLRSFLKRLTRYPSPRWEVFPLGLKDWNEASKTTKTTTFADCGSECRQNLINYKSCHGIRCICTCICICICSCVCICICIWIFVCICFCACINAIWYPKQHFSKHKLVRILAKKLELSFTTF